MSGSLRITDANELKKHDHIDISFKDGTILRYCDPRRFGCFLWTDNPEEHFLLKNLFDYSNTTRLCDFVRVMNE